MSWRWKLSVLFVLIAGFSTLIFMGHETTTQAPPIPERVVDQSGKLLFTGADILAGQGVFQKYGLMDVGSVFGHGAYNGPDFSAEYLHREAEVSLDRMAQKKFSKNYKELNTSEQSDLKGGLAAEVKENRYDTASKSLTLTENQIASYYENVKHFDSEFSTGGKLPLPVEYIKDPTERLELSRFFAWSAWACSTYRPGKQYTYTNNWPPEELVGNAPSVEIFFWSAMSLIMLVGGIGFHNF